MIEIFAGVVLPEEILTDQGSVFIGKLMAQLCKLLDIPSTDSVADLGFVKGGFTNVKIV